MEVWGYREMWCLQTMSYNVVQSITDWYSVAWCIRYSWEMTPCFEGLSRNTCHCHGNHFHTYKIWAGATWPLLTLVPPTNHCFFPWGFSAAAVWDAYGSLPRKRAGPLKNVGKLVPVRSSLPHGGQKPVDKQMLPALISWAETSEMHFIQFLRGLRGWGPIVGNRGGDLITQSWVDLLSLLTLFVPQVALRAFSNCLLLTQVLFQEKPG